MISWGLHTSWHARDQRWFQSSRNQVGLRGPGTKSILLKHVPRDPGFFMGTLLWHGKPMKWLNHDKTKDQQDRAQPRWAKSSGSGTAGGVVEPGKYATRHPKCRRKMILFHCVVFILSWATLFLHELQFFVCKRVGRCGWPVFLCQPWGSPFKSLRKVQSHGGYLNSIGVPTHLSHYMSHWPGTFEVGVKFWCHQVLNIF